jgi:hypothetical protein
MAATVRTHRVPSLPTADRGPAPYMQEHHG